MRPRHRGGVPGHQPGTPATNEISRDEATDRHDGNATTGHAARTALSGLCGAELAGPLLHYGRDYDDLDLWADRDGSVYPDLGPYYYRWSRRLRRRLRLCRAGWR